MFVDLGGRRGNFFLLSKDFFKFFFGDAGSLNAVVYKWKTTLVAGYCILV